MRNVGNLIASSMHGRIAVFYAMRRSVLTAHASLMPPSIEAHDPKGTRNRCFYIGLPAAYEPVPFLPHYKPISISGHDLSRLAILA